MGGIAISWRVKAPSC